jgi:hypothetical protein
VPHAGPGPRRPGPALPFIAVDSPASVRGGRDNWALPKVLAELHGNPTQDHVLRADGEGWWVSARVRPARGPAIPLAFRTRIAQVFPDHSTRAARLTSQGRGRLALVDLDVDTRSSPRTWIKPGRHLGLIVNGEGFVGTADPF